MARSYRRVLKEEIADNLLNILDGTMKYKDDPEEFPADVVFNMIEDETLKIFAKLLYTEIRIGEHQWKLNTNTGFFERVKGEQKL